MSNPSGGSDYRNSQGYAPPPKINFNNSTGVNYGRPPPSQASQPAPVNNPPPHDHHNHPNQLPAYSETAHRVDDEILCSRTVWIIVAVIGVIILTLILLFALGVFGGKGGSSPAAVSTTSTTPHHLTFRNFDHRTEHSALNPKGYMLHQTTQTIPPPVVIHRQAQVQKWFNQ